MMHAEQSYLNRDYSNIGTERKTYAIVADDLLLFAQVYHDV